MKNFYFLRPITRIVLICFFITNIFWGLPSATFAASDRYTVQKTAPEMSTEDADGTQDLVGAITRQFQEGGRVDTQTLGQSLGETPAVSDLGKWEKIFFKYLDEEGLPHECLITIKGKLGLDFSEAELAEGEQIDISRIPHPEMIVSLSLFGKPAVHFEALGNFVNLEMLDLGYAPLKDLSVLKSLKKIWFLNLIGIPASDFGPVFELNNLKILSVAETKFRDFEKLKTLQQLISLNLGGTSAQDKDLVHIVLLKKLEVLDLGSTAVRRINILLVLSKLDSLGLTGTKVTRAEAMTFLRKHPNAKNLEIDQGDSDEFEPYKRAEDIRGASLGGALINANGIFFDPAFWMGMGIVIGARLVILLVSPIIKKNYLHHQEKQRITLLMEPMDFWPFLGRTPQNLAQSIEEKIGKYFPAGQAQDLIESASLKMSDPDLFNRLEIPEDNDSNDSDYEFDGITEDYVFDPDLTASTLEKLPNTEENKAMLLIIFSSLIERMNNPRVSNSTREAVKKAVLAAEDKIKKYFPVNNAEKIIEEEKLRNIQSPNEVKGASLGIRDIADKNKEAELKGFDSFLKTQWVRIAAQKPGYIPFLSNFKPEGKYTIALDSESEWEEALIPESDDTVTAYAPFDPKKWNFSKIKQALIDSKYIFATFDLYGAKYFLFPNGLPAMNPAFKYHSLLVSDEFIYDAISQTKDAPPNTTREKDLKTALLITSFNPDLRFTENNASIGINNLHLHLNVMPGGYPFEKFEKSKEAKTVMFDEVGGVQLSTVENWPLANIIFTRPIQGDTREANIEELAKTAYRFIKIVQAKKIIPMWTLIADGKIIIFLSKPIGNYSKKVQEILGNGHKLTVTEAAGFVALYAKNPKNQKGSAPLPADWALNLAKQKRETLTEEQIDEALKSLSLDSDSLNYCLMFAGFKTIGASLGEEVPGFPGFQPINSEELAERAAKIFYSIALFTNRVTYKGGPEGVRAQIPVKGTGLNIRGVREGAVVKASVFLGPVEGGLKIFGILPIPEEVSRYSVRSEYILGLSPDTRKVLLKIDDDYFLMNELGRIEPVTSQGASLGTDLPNLYRLLLKEVGQEKLAADRREQFLEAKIDGESATRYLTELVESMKFTVKSINIIGSYLRYEQFGDVDIVMIVEENWPNEKFMEEKTVTLTFPDGTQADCEVFIMGEKNAWDKPEWYTQFLYRKAETVFGEDITTRWPPSDSAKRKAAERTFEAASKAEGDKKIHRLISANLMMFDLTKSRQYLEKAKELWLSLYPSSGAAGAPSSATTSEGKSLGKEYEKYYKVLSQLKPGEEKAYSFSRAFAFRTNGQIAWKTPHKISSFILDEKGQLILVRENGEIRGYPIKTLEPVHQAIRDALLEKKAAKGASLGLETQAIDELLEKAKNSPLNIDSLDSFRKDLLVRVANSMESDLENGEAPNPDLYTENIETLRIVAAGRSLGVDLADRILALESPTRQALLEELKSHSAYLLLTELQKKRQEAEKLNLLNRSIENRKLNDQILFAKMNDNPLESIRISAITNSGEVISRAVGRLETELTAGKSLGAAGDDFDLMEQKKKRLSELLDRALANPQTVRNMIDEYEQGLTDLIEQRALSGGGAYEPFLQKALKFQDLVQKIIDAERARIVAGQPFNITVSLLTTLDNSEEEDYGSRGVHTSSISPDGKTLITGGQDRLAKLWNIQNPSKPQFLSTLNLAEGDYYSPTTHCSFSPDSKTLVTGHPYRIKLWGIQSPSKPQLLATLDESSGPVQKVSISPDGRTLVTVTGSQIKFWDIWNPANPQLLTTLGIEGASMANSYILILPSGKMLVIGACYDDVTRLWNIQNLSNPQLSVPLTLDESRGSVQNISILPDGRTLVTGISSEIKFWDIRDPSNPRLLTNLPDSGVNSGSVVTFSISPDGRMLVTGGMDSTLKFWDIRDPLNPKLLKSQGCFGSRNFVYTSSISPDGKTLVTGHSHRAIRIWDLKTISVSGQSLGVEESDEAKLAYIRRQILASLKENPVVVIASLLELNQLVEAKGHEDLVKLLSGEYIKLVVPDCLDASALPKVFREMPNVSQKVIFIPGALTAESLLKIRSAEDVIKGIGQRKIVHISDTEANKTGLEKIMSVKTNFLRAAVISASGDPAYLNAFVQDKATGFWVPTELGQYLMGLMQEFLSTKVMAQAA